MKLKVENRHRSVSVKLRIIMSFTFLPLIWFLCCVQVTDSVLPQQQVDYSGYKVLELLAESLEDFAVLSQLQENSTLDFWLEAPDLDKPAHLLLPPDVPEELRRDIDRFNVTVLIEDLSRFLERDRESMKFTRSRSRDDWSDNVSYFTVNQYKSYEEILPFLSHLESLYPELMSIEYLHDEQGRTVYTHEGRTIPMVKIGVPASYTKRAMWIDGGMHAREWASIAVALNIINELVTKYGYDTEIDYLLESMDWYIVPVANPDGYVHSWSYNRVWRKNMNRNNGHRCWGVDINRNFYWDWGKFSTSTTNPCDVMFGGTGPASEPETIGMQGTIMRLSNELVGMVSLHAYSQLWLYPYGHRPNSEAADWNELEQVALESMRALSSMYGTQYRTGTASSVLYSASGTSIDWAKGVAGIKYTYVIELRPDMGRFFSYHGFSLPESELGPTFVETFAGIKAFAKKMIELYVQSGK